MWGNILTHIGVHHTRSGTLEGTLCLEIMSLVLGLKLILSLRVWIMCIV